MKKTFRPSARLLGTIGEDIIRDMHAAVVEIVKNSYDADASEVEIIIEGIENDNLLLTISDNGHGMTQSDILNKWLVPSTNDKLERRNSPKGRVMQGRKGIGRFAAAILGEKLKIETVADAEMTSLMINWDEFTDDKFLDEVEISIDTKESDLKNGTTFFIKGSAEKLKLWNDLEIEHLIKELRKLLTPIGDSNINPEVEKFNIKLYFKEFSSEKFNGQMIEIKPLPLLNYYDYKISGMILPNGTNTLVYHNKNSGIKEHATDFIYRLSDKEKFTGKINIDFRIFDRDPEAIEKLVNELLASGEEKLGKNEAKNLLNDISGVSIFRNRFRIRPYGDDDNDWLSLDKKRVQMPAVRIGANQISGIIEIEDEEKSNLIEKSARDGLKEDSYYDGLRSVVSQLLNYTELKRYSYRQKSGKGRKNYLTSEQIIKLTDYSTVKSKVMSVMKDANINKTEVDKINDYIDKDIESKVKIAHELEKQLSMYQGQATLGKIMDVVMHEVRKPIQWINNQTKNINRAYARYIKTNQDIDLNKIIKIVNDTPEQLAVISELFKRLDTLATRKRTTMKEFSLNDSIQSALDIFLLQFEENNIKLKTNLETQVSFIGWSSDILIALANILENAIYWVQYSNEEKIIEVSLIETTEAIEISVWNNGPEIESHLLQNNSLFVPGISSKFNNGNAGTGLGLAIAGEAIDRNNGELAVINVKKGTKFLITLSKVESGK